MRRLQPTILALACFCLLALQTIGAHVHVNAAANGELHTVQASHSHAQLHHDHAASDVPLFEDLSVTSVKLLPLIIVVAMLSLTITWRLAGFLIHYHKTGKPLRHAHWRPPLRAPPSPR